MKASKFNKSEIMKKAHDHYKRYKRQGVCFSFGQCLRLSWSETKWRMESEERAERMWAERREVAKKENERMNAECKRLGVDFHTYTMMNYYNRPCGTYYGD